MLELSFVGVGETAVIVGNGPGDVVGKTAVGVDGTAKITIFASVGVGLGCTVFVGSVVGREDGDGSGVFGLGVCVDMSDSGAAGIGEGVSVLVGIAVTVGSGVFAAITSVVGVFGGGGSGLHAWRDTNRNIANIILNMCKGRRKFFTAV